MAEATQKMTVQTGRAEVPVSSETFTPLADIYEGDNVTFVEVELPGAPSNSVEIKVDKGVLTVQATTTLPDFGPRYSQTYCGFVSGQYFRAFALSDEIDRDRIEASLVNGLLTLKLPRAAAAQTRKIEIKTE